MTPPVPRFTIETFPRWRDAPRAIRTLKANCGPLSLWMVATALGKEPDVETIIAACRFVPGQGLWPLRLAIALHDLRFIVEYRSHSVVGPDRADFEEAKAKGIAVLPPLTLREILSLPAITILSYEVIEDSEGHFTPALPLGGGGSVYLPLDYDAPVQAIEIVERQRRAADLDTISVFGFSQ